jgi:dyslexia-associated protein KIAA0319-like protein
MKRESEEKVQQEELLERNFPKHSSFSSEKLLKALQQISLPENDESLPSVYGQERYVNNEDELDPIEYEGGLRNIDNVNLCGPGIGRCNENEMCVRIDREGGICKCKEGHYIRKGKCVRRAAIIPVVPASLIEGYAPQQKTGMEGSEEQQETEKVKLLVSVESKNIQLPENEASLTANVVPENENEKYNFLWSLVDKPENDKNGTITDQTRKTVKVSNLSEGLYRFKLTVTGQNSYGETFVNLTVLPAKRINIPPTPIITPKYQVIKLPNNKAILDGSTSTDDDKIDSYKWELVQGPINYSPTLEQKSTLELADLKEPGNYTFKLTVTDSDKAENSTTAIIQVVEEIDYPPQSNAGADVILYLPHNNITLNGTLSTDDHQIVSYEWTKDASDEAKAVDMQNTHTPYLSLSHLEEGIYTFELKVTDAKGQNSTSKVHVFVKPPTNLPPNARAGNNSTISLPLTWITLNANESTDDIKITQYQWKQVQGPSNSVIVNANDSIANATSLTLGDYIFEVTVVDENNNNATDRVKITVIQGKSIIFLCFLINYLIN